MVIHSLKTKDTLEIGSNTVSKLRDVRNWSDTSQNYGMLGIGRIHLKTKGCKELVIYSLKTKGI